MAGLTGLTRQLAPAFVKSAACLSALASDNHSWSKQTVLLMVPQEACRTATAVKAGNAIRAQQPKTCPCWKACGEHVVMHSDLPHCLLE